jgi:hypothetical protein
MQKQNLFRNIREEYENTDNDAQWEYIKKSSKDKIGFWGLFVLNFNSNYFTLYLYL